MSRPNSQPAEDDDSINFMESVSSFKSEDFPSSDHEDRKTIGIFFFSYQPFTFSYFILFFKSSCFFFFFFS